MTGLGAFLRKELTEIWRTWRLWVIPGMLLFFGVTSPIIALLTPMLMRSVAAGQPGAVFQLPPPNATDASAQFLKSINQIVLIAVVITGAGSVSGERSSGTAILALTKPLSRAAFVVAKIVSQITLVVGATALGTAVCLTVTAIIFDRSNANRLVPAVALWLLYAALLIVVMTLFSSAFRSRGGASGAGLGFYFLTLLLSLWGPAARRSFVGLVPAIDRALLARPVSLGWPVMTALAAIALGAVAAVAIFERQEL